MAQNIDNTCPYVIKIQEQYKVQVMFKTRSKLHATIVLVKGVEWEVDQVKQATILLMEYMCESLVVSFQDLLVILTTLWWILESNSGANVDPDFPAAPPNRLGEKPLQFEIYNAVH